MKIEDVDLIALAGLLHDIGKFGQRAEINIDDYDWQNYCPRDKNKNPTHKHAGYSAKILGDFIVEKQKSGDKRVIGADSLDANFINISAKHHKPETKEEWIIASADRLASGFEREYFEEYNQKVEEEIKTNYKEQLLDHLFVKDKKFDLSKLEPENIFPIAFENKKSDYKALWNDFIIDLAKINKDKKKYPERLKAHALEYLLKKYTSFMPSSTTFKYKDYEPVKPNISLFEHLKTTSIFASAIAGMNEENQNSVLNYYKTGNKEDFEKKVFLLVAGDFFGIQDFIFDEVQTKYAAKILRAKSAFVQILTKVLAYYVCEQAGVGEYSIISTHAGKFEILLPNQKEIIEKLENIQDEFNKYFANQFFGQTGVGITWIEASIEDFLVKKSYKNLRVELGNRVEEIKFKKFGLNKYGYKIFEIDEDLNNQNLCDFCHKRKGEVKKGVVICNECDKYVKLGQKLAEYSRKDFGSMAINKEEGGIHIFKDFYLHFFNEPARENAKKDIYLFDIRADSEFRGIEKWEIASYVASDNILNALEKEYIEKKAEKPSGILTLNELALLSVKDGLKADEKSYSLKRERGVEALMALKGDGDGMGKFIRESDVTDSFAKYNFFAKMVDYYFSVYVPQKFMQNKPLYTVFAGGDDLFVLGAWDEVINLAQNVRDDFVKFTGGKLTFSVGLVMSKANKPVNFLAFNAEEALEDAKDFCCEVKNVKSEKNNICKIASCVEVCKHKEEFCKEENEKISKKDALTIFNESVKWESYKYVKDTLYDTLSKLPKDKLNSSFLYRLIDLAQMSKEVMCEGDIKSTIWKSKLNYTFRRNVGDSNVDVLAVLDCLIEHYPKEFKLAVFEFIYKRR